jgi:hypothetical protein
MPTRADLFALVILVIIVVSANAIVLGTQAKQNCEDILKAIREKKDA